MTKPHRNTVGISEEIAAKVDAREPKVVSESETDSQLYELWNIPVAHTEVFTSQDAFAEAYKQTVKIPSQELPPSNIRNLLNAGNVKWVSRNLQMCAGCHVEFRHCDCSATLNFTVLSARLALQRALDAMYGRARNGN